MESLLVYAEFIDKVNEENAFLDNNILDGLVDSLTNKLKYIDSKALEVGEFWHYELNNLKGK